MRIPAIIIATLFFAGCNSSSDKTTTQDSTNSNTNDSAHYFVKGQDSALESRVENALLALPFIRSSNAYIDSFSNHRHGIAFLVDSVDKTTNEMYVQAGYNGDERFETYYSFYVNATTLAIKVYDPVKDTALSVDDFIKSQK